MEFGTSRISSVHVLEM
jgi:hypothetical protein